MSIRTRRFVVTGGLGVAVVVIALLAMSSVYSSASAKATVRTATVQLGSVASTVTATGNVAPASALSVNFQTGGTVTEIAVKSGDQVVAGQTLAKIDDSQTQAALVSAQAALTSAQANLSNVQQPVTPLVASQNRAALASAQQQVVSAQTNLNGAQQAAQLNAAGYQNSLNQVQAQVDRDTNQANSDQATCSTSTSTSGGSGGSGGSCQSALVQDQNAVAKDRDALVNARQQQASGALKDQQAIVQAQNSLVSAQDNLATTVLANNAKAVATPASVAQAQSQVAQAQAALLAAQKNEANTTLTAPGNGTVATVNGIVGQTVSGGGAAGSSSSSSTSGSGGASSGTSSSSAFVTLDDTTAMQVVGGFAEADASRIQSGRAASITLNALPNQQISGKVTKIDVTSTVVSNVVTYNVTIGLTDLPAGVRPGMTANISVVVSQHDNVLYLPTADVTSRGGASTVTVMQNGKQVVQAVSVGMVGDQSTEITSGLTEGETVVAPTVSVTPTGSGAGTGTPRAGAGFGGLGGGLGGG